MISADSLMDLVEYIFKNKYLITTFLSIENTEWRQ